MKTTLKSKVPTNYQRQSISSFGLPLTQWGTGAITCEKEFQTKKEAINYMLELAEDLAENSKELKEMRSDIKKRNALYYDAAVLSIHKNDE